MSDQFDDFIMGTVVFEIDVFLSPQSGRDKHADLDDQGAFLMPALERGLRQWEMGEGAAFGSIRYLGAGKVDRPTLAEQPIGPVLGPFPGDEDRLHVSSLRGAIGALGRALMRLIEDSENPEATWNRLVESHERNAAVIANWTVSEDNAILDDVDFDPWRDALRWHP